MEYQTIYNPATKQTLSIDLSLPNAHQQIASYYQQGWTSPPAGTSISPPSAGITGGTTSGGTITLPGYYAPAGGGAHVAYLPGQALPPGAVIVIPPKTIQVKGPSLPPNIEGITPEGNIVLPSGQVIAPPVSNTPSILNPFKSGDSYNLLDIVQTGTPGVILMAKQTWPDQDWNYLEYAARPIFDISTKAGSEAWDKMSKEKQQLFRPMIYASESEYAKMTDREKLSVKGITPDVVVRTGLQVATGVLDTAAIMALPLYDTITNWNEKSTKGKIFSIGMDALCIIPSAFFATRTISATVRAGGTIRGGLKIAIKNELLAPYYMVRHPIETFKAPFVTLREFTSKKYVPYEVIVGSTKTPAGKMGMSDVRMGIGAGLEEAGASLEATQKLQARIIAGEMNPSVMQGVVKVEMTGTGMQRILGAGIVDHSGPAFENMLNALEETGKTTKVRTGVKGLLGMETDVLQPGKIVVEGKEGGLYAAGTGTLFHQGAATGGSGQIAFHAMIDTGGEGVSKLPKAVAKLQDVRQMEKTGVKVLGSGEYAGEVMPGIKAYKGRIEGEVVVTENSELVLVPSKNGKTTTFKWKIPDAKLTEQANSVRKQLQAALVDMENACK